MNEELVLHGYWRSSAAYRVRIALNLKGLSYQSVPHDLRTGAQHDPRFVSLSPQGLVPALLHGDAAITQSLAILEWIEERYPAPPLLPAAADDRAMVRAMAALMACDIHPLNNLRVIEALRADFDANPAAIENWARRWITAGFQALSVHIGRCGGSFAFGDLPSLADCCLIPQIYSARRFGIDMRRFPQLEAIEVRATALPEFRDAAPENQPDADL